MSAPNPHDDLRATVREAVASLGSPPTSSDARTSDLSLDEELNLHAIGWEAVELVSGYSVFSIPMGAWSWGQGEITAATEAQVQAFSGAARRLHHEAAAAGGHGVVGVHIERSTFLTHIAVSLIGTAIRPIGASRVGDDRVFVSDLSARDFSRLVLAGWEPLGLATGTSFVYAPRRTIGAALAQQSQNVELTNFTEAIYAARELAMDRMQQSAISLHGSGVVEVKVLEGPMAFASHAVGFTAWGTVVRLVADEHRRMRPSLVVSLNDSLVTFEAATLG
ncbi:MAG: heavy metal-binding domain-containing protein [Acidimicrobiales bacterium]